jgi:cob(I)alamin adenosyltransferase
MRGLFHIYTGDGKGKSTAALGLALRAYGNGMRILYCQFLKSGDSSELQALALLQEHLTILQYKPVKGFYKKMCVAEQERVCAEQRELFARGQTETGSGKYDVVILDEIINALSLGILSEDEVCAFIRERHPKWNWFHRSMPCQDAGSADMLQTLSRSSILMKREWHEERLDY